MSNKSNERVTPKIVSIFSGCGGLDLGFHMEGYQTIWANDFAEWAVASFRENLGDVIHYGDITKIDPYTDKSIPNCDLILGGFPCQLLSETDRRLGDQFTDITVLTMYKVTGKKGWNGQKIWIPNIKLPSDMIYYTMANNG